VESGRPVYLLDRSRRDSRRRRAPRWRSARGARTRRGVVSRPRSRAAAGLLRRRVSLLPGWTAEPIPGSPHGCRERGRCRIGHAGRSRGGWRGAARHRRGAPRSRAVGGRRILRSRAPRRLVLAHRRSARGGPRGGGTAWPRGAAAEARGRARSIVTSGHNASTTLSRCSLAPGARARREARPALRRGRWIDDSRRDLAAVAREGNFRKVFPFGPDIAGEAEAALREAR
jgi:hypothetical protein